MITTFALGALLLIVIELGVEQLQHVIGLDAQNRFLLGDHAFVRHFDGDADGRAGGAFAVTGLQHPQLAVLNREFHVLHFAVVAVRASRTLR